MQESDTGVGVGVGVECSGSGVQWEWSGVELSGSGGTWRGAGRGLVEWWIWREEVQGGGKQTTRMRMVPGEAGDARLAEERCGG